MMLTGWDMMTGRASRGQGGVHTRAAVCGLCGRFGQLLKLFLKALGIGGAEKKDGDKKKKKAA